MDSNFSLNIQKEEKNVSLNNNKEFERNKMQKGQNNNMPINKDSYLFLHSKKFLNKVPSNDTEKNNINNNFQSLMDFTEPQPQSYNNYNINDIKNNKDYNSLINFSSKNNNNVNFSNQSKNKKLLEEYFRLKNDSSNNYSKSNYYTYNNNIYTPNSNQNNKQSQEEQYKPLVKRQKQKKQANSKTQNIPKAKANNKNNIINQNNKKSSSLKNANSLSRIYQPEKNMKESPSFTPIKNKVQPLSKKNNSKENIKHSPYFGTKSNSNANVIVPNNLIKQNKINEKLNYHKITYSEDSDRHIKSILKNKDFLSQKEKNNKKNHSKKNIANIPYKKNLTPTRKEVQTCFDFKKKKFLTKNEKSYGLMTNLTSTSYNNISSINSTESYWRKKDREKRKKLEQIKTERILKEEKELQEKPKINYNSKRIIGKKYQNQYKTDVFDRLSDISQIQNHNANIEKIRNQFKESHTPLINNNSRRMKRTIDDLYQWKNKNERKKIESAKYLDKISKNKISINPQSEEILKEKKSDYINKKVEDRLLEQGRLQQYKNEIQRKQYLNYISQSKKYINNEYVNVHSRYLESPNYSNDNYAQKGNKSSDRIINKGNRVNFNAISLRNNDINYNGDESYDNNMNNYYTQNNKNDINYLNNMNNINEQNKKEIYFENNNGNNLINGNINNYIINNNFNNNIMFKPQKNQNEINENLKNNHYQYFPNYNSNRNSNVNNYNKNVPKSNYNNNENKPYNFYTEKVAENKYKNNNRHTLENLNSNNESNDIMNIRKHLNEFYENKRNSNIQSENLENYLSKRNKKENDESIKNDLLKGLLVDGNGKEQNENLISRGSYSNNNNNINNKINQNLNNNMPTFDNSIKQNMNNINSYNKFNSLSFNQNDKNISEVNKQKYNFNQELLKDIHKIPKSSGLNFNSNKNKNFNYFQFKFDTNENKNNEIIDNNNIEKPYEYIQKDNNDRENIGNNNSQIKNIKDKYTIEDSVNINNIVSNSNSNIINNNNNKIQNYNSVRNNFDEIEKQRRKQDLLQMINFSTNLKLNNNNNYINNQNQQINQNNNFSEYENYNIVQSYEES